MDDCTRIRAGRGIREICLTVVALILALVSKEAETRELKGPEKKTDPLHRRFDLEIYGGPCTKVLVGISRITEIQILFDYAVLDHAQCLPNGYLSRGDWPFDAALDSLLRDTNFTFDWVNDHTVAVYPKPKQVGQSPEAWQEVLIRSDSYGSPQRPIGSDIFKMTLSDIENSGFQTVPELVHSDPQVFGGGPTEDTYLGREAATNASRGSGINLRGLDAGSVVVLVDGHRVAMSGTAGGYADIANLPLDAIKSMSIMTDGTSLHYGADAISGVVNFETRNDVDGATSKVSIGTATDGGLGRLTVSSVFGGHWEAGRGTLILQYDDSKALPASDRGQATSDLRRWGGPNFGSPFGNPGTIFAGGQTYALPALIPGTENLYDLWDNVDVLASQRHFSLVGNVQQELAEAANLWIHSWLSRREYRNTSAPYSAILSVPKSNPFYLNPTSSNDPVTVLYGFGNDLGPMVTDGDVDAGAASFGVDTAWAGWKISGSFSYAFERLHEQLSNSVNESALSNALADPNPLTAFDAFGGANGQSTIDSLRDERFYRYFSDFKTVTGTAERSLAITAVHEVSLRLGAEFRQQSFDSNSVQSMLMPGIRQAFQRNLRAAYSEVIVPVTGQTGGASLFEGISLSLGARYEGYSGGLRATSPRAGVRWTPFRAVSLRGTWSRSFRPPNLPDKANLTTSEISVIPDKSAPSGTSAALLWTGSNSALQAERAINKSLGIDLTPLDELSLSLTYFDINSTHRVAVPVLTPNVLQDATFQGVVLRSPTESEQSDVCSSSQFYGSAAVCRNTPVAVIVDGRLQNVQSLITDGFDFTAKYRLASEFGKWSLDLNGTYLLSYDEHFPHEAFSLLGTQNNPNNVRIRSTVNWEWRRISASASGNYTNHYRDTNNAGREVASWTTIDLQLGYKSEVEGIHVNDFRVAVTVQNLFNRYPPYLANPLGVAYDQENGDITGRTVSLRVTAAF